MDGEEGTERGLSAVGRRRHGSLSPFEGFRSALLRGAHGRCSMGPGPRPGGVRWPMPPTSRLGVVSSVEHACSRPTGHRPVVQRSRRLVTLRTWGRDGGWGWGWGWGRRPETLFPPLHSGDLAQSDGVVGSAALLLFLSSAAWELAARQPDTSESRMEHKLVASPSHSLLLCPRSPALARHLSVRSAQSSLRDCRVDDG